MYVCMYVYIELIMLRYCIPLCIVVMYCPRIDRSVVQSLLIVLSFFFVSDRVGGFNPLIISAYKGHFEVVFLLCQRGANIEARTNVSDQCINACIQTKIC